MKKTLLLLPLYLLLGLPAARAATASLPPTAYLPIRAVPDSLDPSQLKVDAASYIFRQVAEGLFAIGEGFQVYPRVAEKAEWSHDQRRLKIRLRKTKFSDGTIVTPESVVKALSYCIKNAEKTLLVAVRAIEGYSSFAGGKSTQLSGLSVAGPSEIEIRLSRKAPLLLDDLAQADCHIVKPAPTGSMDLLKGAVGTGPYRLKSASADEVILERSVLYATPIQGPEVAVFRKTGDFGRFEKLRSWVTMATTEHRPEKDDSFREIESSELGSHHLIFNNAKAPFRSAEVRKAVALALDFELLANELGWSHDTLQEGFIPLGMAGFRRRTLSDRPKKIVEAKALLKKAGFGARHPLRFTILLSKLPAYEKEAAIWPRLFSDVPIEARVELMEHAERNARQDRGEFEAIRAMKFAGSVEAHRVFASYLSGSNYNPTRSREPECDRLTAQAVETNDRDARLKFYEKVDYCLVNRAILVPLASLQPGFVLLKKPWRLTRTNRYLLYPYWISEWRRDEAR
jgi:oligopeptide transport system substrate-binding protein